ncbi:MAG: hemolysin family protein [Bacteroidales bacterium]|jgi:putative hemolysin|nr:hemolysin family protein [Bacteroidales bacterium]
MEIVIILLLILFNGILSLSEFSLVSARPAKLDVLIGNKKKGATKALKIKNNPDKYLSTIQVCITLIGIFTGLYSGDTLVQSLKIFFEDAFSLSKIYSGAVAKAVVLIGITYFTIVLGELLPKKLALCFSENILRRMSDFLSFFSKLFFPFVWILTKSLDLLTHIFRLKGREENKITEEEILATIQRGADEGAVEDVEQDIVERVFDLGDRDVESVMTHRNDLICIDISATLQEISAIIYEDMHAYYPVIDKHLDKLVGVISLKDLFGCISSQNEDIRPFVHAPKYYPETTSTYKALEGFRQSELYYGLIINEFGSLQGMITSADIMEAVLGKMSEPDEDEETIISQSDNSWLVDGQYSFYDFLSYFDMEDIYQEYDYNTLSGLILQVADHIPEEGEIIKWRNFSFEITKMDSARIDKILVKKEEQTIENNKKEE